MWVKKQAYRGAKPTDHLRYRPSRARDSEAEGGETEPGRQANCDGTIIRLLRVRVAEELRDSNRATRLLPFVLYPCVSGLE